MLFFLEMIENERDRKKVVLLYNSYHQQLYYMAYSWTKNQGVSEELVHDTYISIIKYLENIDENVYEQLKLYLKKREKNSKLKVTDFTKESNCSLCLKTWNYMATTLKHKIIDWTRRESKIADFSVEEVFDSSEIMADMCIEKEYLEKEKNSILHQFLKELKSPYREVILLHYFNNMTTEEIGKMLNKSPENIRQLLTRGRQKLKKCMEERGYHES